MLIAQSFANESAHIASLMSAVIYILAPIMMLFGIASWISGVQTRDVVPFFLGAIVLLFADVSVNALMGQGASSAALYGMAVLFLGALKGISILAAMIAVGCAALWGTSRAFGVTLTGEKLEPKKSKKALRIEKQLAELDQVMRDLEAIEIDPERTKLRQRLLAEDARLAERVRIEQDRQRDANSPTVPNNALVARNGTTVDAPVNVSAGRIWVTPGVTRTQYPLSVSPSRPPAKESSVEAK